MLAFCITSSEASVGDGYFDRLIKTTSSRVWVNNPTQEEVGLALRQGAVGCTTNPAYGGNLLRRAPAEIRPVIAAAVREVEDDELAAEETQRRLVIRILTRFRPIFDASDGQLGFVSLQGPPEADTPPSRTSAKPLMSTRSNFRNSRRSDQFNTFAPASSLDGTPSWPTSAMNGWRSLSTSSAARIGLGP